MFQNLREMWDEAGAGARLGLATGVLLILAIVVWLSISVLRPEYQTLFSDLDPQDASAMVAELDKMKVPYRLNADGTAIMVDKSQVHALRLKLLGKSGGPLRGGVGFEIFNNTDFGMTEFAQKINYQRALQGELTRTITALDEVRSARVHLVMPESGLFRKGGVKPKASITLAMKDGRSLAPEQVLGIQRLVAAAIPEIEPSAVTIADQRGVTLTRAGGGDGDDATSARLGVKSDVEAYIARKLVAVFDRAFGPGRVIVSVDATINHDQVKVTREDVLPLGTRGGEAVGAVARSRTTQSEPTGSGSAATVDAVKTAATGSSSSEVEYLNGRRIEQVVSMPGSIKRLSVGIVLPSAMDKARLEEIRQLVATTAGINPSRGDEIAISSLDMSAGNAARANAEAMLKPAPEPLSAEPQPSAETANRTVFGSLQPRPEWVLGAVAILLLLLGAAWLAGRSGQRAARPLTPEAREEVLQRVQTWVRREPPLRGERTQGTQP